MSLSKLIDYGISIILNRSNQYMSSLSSNVGDGRDYLNRRHSIGIKFQRLLSLIPKTDRVNYAWVNDISFHYGAYPERYHQGKLPTDFAERCNRIYKKYSFHDLYKAC